MLSARDVPEMCPRCARVCARGVPQGPDVHRQITELPIVHGRYSNLDYNDFFREVFVLVLLQEDGTLQQKSEADKG